MNTPKLDDILDTFTSFLESEEDVTDPDDSLLYIEVITSELQSIKDSFAGSNVEESVKLAVACARIPGLLHLYKIY